MKLKLSILCTYHSTAELTRAGSLCSTSCLQPMKCCKCLVPLCVTAVCTALSGHVDTLVLPVQGTTPTESSVIGRLLTARGKENHQFSDM